MKDKITKYIFVTGGVVSGLGKGITAASLSRLLKARGYKVTNQKFDPYINIDPTNMSPIQHGEVFVTNDGAECDLDIGHYERFTDENMTANSNITAGKIYLSVLEKERSGDYGGVTVQVIPHITDYVKSLITKKASEQEYDIIITEIGGTVGDMESRFFLEAIRQMQFDIGRENVLYVHVVLMPYLEKSGEIKTKPAQHSVKELLSLGIQPDMLVCRTQIPMDKSIKSKISLYCNVAKEAVIQNVDASLLYEIPLLLESESFASVALKKLNLPDSTPKLNEWHELLRKQRSASNNISIALVGKYTQLHDAYLSLTEALNAAAIANGIKLTINWVDADGLENKDISTTLEFVNGIIIPAGFGVRASKGKLAAAKYARLNKIPCLGIGMGSHIMAIEFAQNVLNLQDANSTEFDPMCQTPIVHNLQNTFRRGAYECIITNNTLAYDIYNESMIEERHRHRHEINIKFKENFDAAGMVFSGITPDNKNIEIIELKESIHPWYIGTQFLAELKSRPTKPHPLFLSFLNACIVK